MADPIYKVVEVVGTFVSAASINPLAGWCCPGGSHAHGQAGILSPTARR